MSRTSALFASVAVLLEASLAQDLVKNMSIKFVEGLDACMDELDIKDVDPIVFDVKNFWQEDFILSNYMSGCTVHCLASKLELIDEDGYLQHHKMKEFVVNEGADDETASQITTLIQTCLDNAVPDACNRSVVAAQCVKQRLQEWSLAPAADVMLEEILADDDGKRK